MGEQMEKESRSRWPLVLALLIAGTVLVSTLDSPVEAVMHALTTFIIFYVPLALIARAARKKQANISNEPCTVYLVPFALGVAGGLIATQSSYAHGATPIRIAFGGVFAFGFWWMIAAGIAWLLRRSRGRAKPLLISGALVLLVSISYLLVTEWADEPVGGYLFSTECITWQEATQQVGSYACVCGTIVDTYDSGAAFFMQYVRDGRFHALSREHFWEDIEGQCLQVCGIIEQKGGNTRIVVTDPETQVFACP